MRGRLKDSWADRIRTFLSHSWSSFVAGALSRLQCNSMSYSLVFCSHLAGIFFALPSLLFNSIGNTHSWPSAIFQNPISHSSHKIPRLLYYSTFCIGPFPRFNSYEPLGGGPFWQKRNNTTGLIEIGRGHSTALRGNTVVWTRTIQPHWCMIHTPSVIQLSICASPILPAI